jgi:hypothetical protein
MNTRGFSAIDFVLLLAILILAVLVVSKVDDVYDTSTREDCYQHQIALDRVLWETCYEQSREIWDVQEAYSIRYSDNRPAVLVILFNPRLDDHGGQRMRVNVDLTRLGVAENSLCPLHTKTLTQPAIDYWFSLGRWHCLFNRYHSE